MKSRRHRNDSSPFSLFSFQDIITGISGIMVFVLLILSLELTIPEKKKESEEEIRKTLFAQDPMEIFVAGKLEIANSHTVITQEELLDLYLQDGAAYFEIFPLKRKFKVFIDDECYILPSCYLHKNLTCPKTGKPFRPVLKSADSSSESCTMSENSLMENSNTK